MSKENIPIGGEPDCSRHKKEIAGISDMKVLAEMIGDLHYEALADLFDNLSTKFFNDARKDAKAGRELLSNRLYDINYNMHHCADVARIAWKISKPFMTDKTQPK
jgi:hypothetical protein